MAELNYIQNIVQFVKRVGGGVRLNCVCLEWENGWEVVVVIILQGTVPIPHTCKFSLLYRNNQSIFPLYKLQQYQTSHKILITILLQLSLQLSLQLYIYFGNDIYAHQNHWQALRLLAICQELEKKDFQDF